MGKKAKRATAGGRVHVWTLDEKEDLQECVDQGVDAVISNRPGKVLGWLDKYRD